LARTLCLVHNRLSLIANNPPPDCSVRSIRRRHSPANLYSVSSVSSVSSVVSGRYWADTLQTRTSCAGKRQVAGAHFAKWIQVYYVPKRRRGARSRRRTRCHTSHATSDSVTYANVCAHWKRRLSAHARRYTGWLRGGGELAESWLCVARLTAWDVARRVCRASASYERGACAS
jgi:hypothetical protein